MVKRAKRTSGEPKLPFELLGSILESWIRETHPNTERKGCPGRETLEVVVRAESKLDEHTVNHLGQCAACLDEIKEIKREIAEAASSD